MPEGALLTHTVEPVLLDLAARGATGCLFVRDQEGDEAEVYLRDGLVYAVFVPGRRAHARRPPDVARRPDARGARRGAGDPAHRAAGLAAGRAAGAPGLRRPRGGRGVRRRAPQGRARRPAGLAGRRLEVPQEQEDPPGRRPADPVDRRCSTSCATARTTWETILRRASAGPDAVPTLAGGLAVRRRRPRPERVGPALQGRRRAVGGRPRRRVRVHRSSRPARSSCGWSRPGWSACPGTTDDVRYVRRATSVPAAEAVEVGRAAEVDGGARAGRSSRRGRGRRAGRASSPPRSRQLARRRTRPGSSWRRGRVGRGRAASKPSGSARLPEAAEREAAEDATARGARAG